MDRVDRYGRDEWLGFDNSFRQAVVIRRLGENVSSLLWSHTGDFVPAIFAVIFFATW